MNNDLIQYQTFVSDVRDIITRGRNSAYVSARTAMIMTYWNIGKRIVEQEQSGLESAEYGKYLITILSDELTKEFGKGFSERNLRNFRKFYILFSDDKIWSHFCCLLRVPDENTRIWYLYEAVIVGMKNKTKEYQKSGIELIKSPNVAEFLGFKNEDTFLESHLESAILSHIRDFLMEMGRGFAFVSRYVLIDLKMGKITHQNVCQIDVYVKMYDDNPIIGILLCAETDEDII